MPIPLVQREKRMETRGVSFFAKIFSAVIY